MGINESHEIVIRDIQTCDSLNEVLLIIDFFFI